MAGFDKNIPVETIIAGKFRRYNSLTFWQQMRRLRKIVLPNIADAFKIFFGTVQSFFKLVAWRPDVIFAKGGYVCMPVGFAARLLRIPLVIHDSDTHPGLTNRVLSRFAQVIAKPANLWYNKTTDRSKAALASKIQPFLRLLFLYLAAFCRRRRFQITPNAGRRFFLWR